MLTFGVRGQDKGLGLGLARSCRPSGGQAAMEEWRWPGVHGHDAFGWAVS
jgi:hypothetical protein